MDAMATGDDTKVQPTTGAVSGEAQPAVRSLFDRIGSLLGRLSARRREAEALIAAGEAARRRLDAEIARRRHTAGGTPPPPTGGPGDPPSPGPDPSTPVPPPPTTPPTPDIPPVPEPGPGTPPPGPSPAPAPQGGPKPPSVDDQVILVGKIFAAGDKGVRFMRGITYFPAAWAFKFDRGKLDGNLQAMDAEGDAIDYVRWFAQVGGTSWEDRTVDPRWPDYWQVMEGTLTAIKATGKRSMVTIMASAGLLSRAERRDLCDRWATFSQRHAAKIQLIEIANESFVNGPDDTEVRELSARLRQQTSVLVAASSPMETATGGFPLLANGVSDIASVHWDRSVNGTGGMWRPVRQPWDYQFGGDVPAAMQSGEPIGIDSSVASDDNPERIAAALAVCGIAGGTGYVMHTGAGVRGGGAADLARGRKANLGEQPRFSGMLVAFANAAKWIPDQVASWTPQNQHWPDHPFIFNYETKLVRAYAALQGNEFFCLPHGITAGPVTFTVKQAWHVKVYRPENGALVFEQDVAAGGTFTVSDAGSVYPDPGQGYSVAIRGTRI